MKTIVEVCCGSLKDALRIEKAGAQRVELVSALNLGGLTPSLGTLKLIKENTSLKVVAMIRPRGAGFCYSEEDFEVMKLDAEILLQNGADGIVFGFLTEDRNIDEEKTAALVRIAKSFNKEAIFHRAFDCLKDYHEGVKKLIELGVDRLLTSGLENKACDGKDVIKELQREYGDKIQILAGSGVNVTNAKELVDYCGINQVHSSCKGWETDITTSGEKVSYAYENSPHELDYGIVVEEEVKKLVDSLE